MLKSLAIGGILACAFLIVINSGQKNVGPGKWSVLNIMKCDNDDKMAVKMDVNRRKISRTQDGFNCNLTLDEPLGENHSVRVEICKMVTGGCKEFGRLDDNSLPEFIKTNAGMENVKKGFEASSMNQADFPLPKGNHTIRNFVFDYNGLPKEGPYGEFMASGYAIKDGKDVLCMKLHVLFEEREDEEE